MNDVRLVTVRSDCGKWCVSVQAPYEYIKITDGYISHGDGLAALDDFIAHAQHVRGLLARLEEHDP